VSTNFPGQADTFIVPPGSTPLGTSTPTHTQSHQNLGDALTAVEGVLLGPIHYNVKKYGAKGDGTTDDTAAIQNAMNAVPVTGGTVFFPVGVYKVTATLVVPDIRGFRMIGASVNASEIRMFTNNTPIIKTTGQFQRAYEFAELQLSYNTQQNFASHPNSIALFLQTANPSLNSVYYSMFRRLYIRQSTWGIKSGGTDVSVWNCTFEDLQFGATEHSCITIIPSPATGQPVNYFRRISSLGEGGPATTGVCLDLFDEADLEAIDIEDWSNAAITLYGPSTLNGLHVERHNVAAGYGVAILINMSGAAHRIDGVNVSGTVGSGSGLYLFGVAASSAEIGPSRVSLNGAGFWVALTASGAANAEIVPPNVVPGSTLFYAGVLDANTSTQTTSRIRYLGPDGRYNVKAYGAKGDGTTDDTAAIQAALDGSILAAGGATVYFPPGTYKVTSTLNVPDAQGTRIVGSSWFSTQIRMYTNNTPIFKTVGQYQFGYAFEDLRLTYNTQQSNASHPNSACIQIQSALTTPSSWGHTFKRLYLEKGTYGIHSTGTISVWNCRFEQIYSSNTAHSVITLTSAFGQPQNVFDQISHIGSATTTTGRAIDLNGEATMRAIDIEDWTGTVIGLESAAFTLDGLHLERCVATTTNPLLFISDCTGRISGFTLYNCTGGTFPCAVFMCDSSRVHIGTGTVNFSTNAANMVMLRVANTNSTSLVEMSWTDGAQTLNALLYPTGFDGAVTLKNTRVHPGPSNGVPTIASATTTTLAEYGEVFIISGTTAITSVTASWGQRRVTLIFSGALTFTDGSNLKLNGNFVTTADDTISLVCDGTNWYETSRSAN